MFLVFAGGLCINNDLVFLIDRHDAVIALNRAFAGGRFDRSNLFCRRERMRQGKTGVINRTAV